MLAELELSARRIRLQGQHKKTRDQEDPSQVDFHLAHQRTIRRLLFREV